MEPIILPRISDQRPLVSVVSITFNHELYIRECLEGFMMQKTDFPIEVIIHDDASTDHTADIIREYYEKSPDLFHVIIERENQYSKHKPFFKQLYEMAQGKYLAFCEGDDYWTDPLKLQKQYDFMESHPGCSLVYHDIKEEDKNKDATCFLNFVPGYINGEKIALQWMIPTCSILFKKEVANEYVKRTHEEQRFVCGDTIMYLCAAAIGSVYGMDESMAVYRRHRGSATTIVSSSSKKYNHYIALSKHFPEFRKAIRKRMTYDLCKKMLSFFCRREIKEAGKCFVFILKSGTIASYMYVLSVLLKKNVKKITPKKEICH